jgi:hypothetical protein
MSASRKHPERALFQTAPTAIKTTIEESHEEIR